MAHLTRPAEISGVSAGLFPETAAGNRAYSDGRYMSYIRTTDMHQLSKQKFVAVLMQQIFRFESG